MHVLLWILQGLLSLHTVMGAIWKFSHSAEQTMPSLKVIPQGVWLAMSGLELLAAAGLIVPMFYKPLARLLPLSAGLVVVEMLCFSALHLAAGTGQFGPLGYWLVVAALSGFIAYGRTSIAPV